MADYFDKIRPVLEALQIGEAVIYPISRMKSVRTQASELGLGSSCTLRDVHQGSGITDCQTAKGRFKRP